MESTPNPSVMKFVSNKKLIDGSLEILNKKEAKGIPLAEAIYSLSFVKSIFINTNFISITKDNSVEWHEIAIEIREFLSDKLNTSNEILNNLIPKKENQDSNNNLKNFTDIEQEISKIINDYIKPAVEADGGQISLKSYIKGSVTVSLKGACSGCPSSTITLKNGIEHLLKQKLGSKISEVIADND